MKRKTHLFVAWSELDGRIGDGMARCEVFGRPRLVISPVSGKTFKHIRIRDPKGKLWWTPTRMSARSAGIR